MDELPRIKVSVAELSDPKVDEVLAREAAAPRRAAGPGGGRRGGPVERPRVALYYNPIVVYPIAAGLAAFIVWRLLETGMAASERAERAGGGGDETIDLAGLILFPLMGAAIGLFIAMTDALLSRNLGRAAHCGVVGLGVGFLGACVGTVVGGVVYALATGLVEVLVAPTLGDRESYDITDVNGLALFVQMAGRAVAWTVVASGMGIGQGVALKSKKLVVNGLIGGLLGGFLGGLAFDPLDKAFHGDTAGLSRMFGLLAVGVSVGFFTGLVESIAKDSWLYMKAGPLAGKEFVLYRDPTVLGSSPKSDVYLFKDAAIEPRHAEVRAVGTRKQLVDLGTKQGTYVNGKRIESQVLESGDTIVLGETVLQYVEREKK